MPAERERDVLAHRQGIEERRVLKQEAHTLTHTGQGAAVERGDVLVLDEHPARVWTHQADDVPQRDALAGPASPQQTKGGRARDLEGHVVEHATAAERLGDTFEAHSGLRHLTPPVLMTRTHWPAKCQLEHQPAWGEHQPA